MTTTVSDDVLPVVTRADHVPGPGQGCWTYADYLTLPDDGNRYEIIDGVLYQMPGPTKDHQRTVIRFAYHLMTHVEYAGLGQVLTAPFDVDLPAHPNMVQPDILVVLKARLGVLTDAAVVGAPDLVVEVSSPSTATHDRGRKLSAYARSGVREYWLADPIARTVEVLHLEGDDYRSAGVFRNGALLPTQVIPEFPVAVRHLFPEP